MALESAMARRIQERDATFPFLEDEVRHDPRAIANWILDMAAGEEDVSPISGDKLHGLLFLVHARNVSRRRGNSSIKGYFEAREDGAFHPTVLNAFGARSTLFGSFRAFSKNYVTGETRPINHPIDNDFLRDIRDVLANSGRLTGQQINRMICAPGGPWDHIRKKVAEGKAVTYQIDAETIASRIQAMRLCLDSTLG